MCLLEIRRIAISILHGNWTAKTVKIDNIWSLHATCSTSASLILLESLEFISVSTQPWLHITDGEAAVVITITIMLQSFDFFLFVWLHIVSIWQMSLFSPKLLLLFLDCLTCLTDGCSLTTKIQYYKKILCCVSVKITPAPMSQWQVLSSTVWLLKSPLLWKNSATKQVLNEVNSNIQWQQYLLWNNTNKLPDKKFAWNQKNSYF